MADKQAVMTVQDPERGIFVNNCYAGNWKVLPADAAAVKADPLLAAPAVESEEMNALEGYSLMAGSPCMDAGVIIDEHGGEDILGNVLPQKGKPDIGAVQH